MAQAAEGAEQRTTPDKVEKNPAHFDGGHFTNPDTMRPYKLLFSGAVAGVVSRTSTAPIDRLRMLFQVHESSRMTIMQGIRKMAAEGSIKSFFRGNGANCLKIAPETALKFAINDRIKRFVCKGHDTSSMGYFERLLSGGISGGIAQVKLLASKKSTPSRRPSYRLLPLTRVPSYG